MWKGGGVRFRKSSVPSLRLLPNHKLFKNIYPTADVNYLLTRSKYDHEWWKPKDFELDGLRLSQNNVT
jgi:hypothetical protein